MTLHVHPCLDSEEMAASRQRELDIPRSVAAALGRSAVKACLDGYYTTPHGTRVDWHDAVQAAIAGKQSIPQDHAMPSGARSTFAETHVQVSNETTLGAALRLVQQGARPLALNFANGIHPGGGVLQGARAQEETLCRCSALLPTLFNDPMYAAHRKRPLPDSTDWVIYSPGVPVFRSDDGVELHQPWLLSFITCAAPVAAAIGQPAAGDLLLQRIDRVLQIARSLEYSDLVLGAWGCGAFANDPRRTALDFRRSIENKYGGAFSEIVFAIADWSPDRKFLGPFRDAFVNASTVSQQHNQN